MARDHSGRRYSDRSGTMHLFDFNETLSGKRFPDEKRAALDSQMERLYKARGSNSKPRREDVEVIRNMSLNMSSKKVQGGTELLAKGNGNRETQRAPSVVARLMGLDTLPTASAPAKTVDSEPILPVKQVKKKPVEQVPSRMEKSNRKPIQMQGPTAPPPFQREDYQQTPYAQEKSRFSHPRFADDQIPAATKETELPDLYELEEMKRQLALKQMLVREKLNEAKRLLTGEKLSDRKWIAASDKLNQSKEFLDAIDFFQSNRDAFLKYVSDQDSVLGKHIEPSGRTPRYANAERPIPDGLRNPIVRKVMEGRREDALRNSSRHSDFGSEENLRNPVPDNQVATRIVVLKPSPNRQASPTAGSFPPYSSMIDKPQPVARRAVESPTEDLASNPREIAKEIARQVRESVVRDLARNASSNIAETGSEKRLNVTIDNLEGPRLTRGTSSDYMRTGATEGGILTPSGRGSRLKPKVPLEQPEDTPRKSPQPQKKTPRPRQSSGSSPPLTRPVSKGIVVLVPDQSVSARNPRTSETQNRDAAPSDSGKLARKDRTRRSQQIYLDSTAHKLGDTFRKLRSGPLDEKRSDTNKELTDSKRSDSSRPGSADTLGYGGSFLLRSTGLESQGENEGSCDTVDSGYTADVCVSDIKSTTPENTRSSSDCVSSCDSVPSEPSTVDIGPCEQQTVVESEPVFVPLHASPVSSVEAEEEDVKDVQVFQEESTKDTPTTSDTVDVDETSVSSDNSGQPSPISVLESSFEESPAQVDFGTISSELEELRQHLRLLKWEGQDEGVADDLEDLTSGLEDVVVDKVVVEEISGNGFQSTVLSEPAEDADDLLFQLLELDKRDISDLHCPDGRKDEQTYVRNIFIAAGLLSNDKSVFMVQHHSQAHALDPMLFEKLEQYYRSRDQQPEKVTSSNGHRHLFDVVDELLTQKYLCHPWLATVRGIPCGSVVLAEVWSRLRDYFNYPQGEDLQQTVENLIEKYLSKGDRWTNLRVHVESIGVELEEAILSELFEETISCLTESN